MRTKEYNRYMQKKKLVLMKLDMQNVDQIILERLKKHKINIRNKNIESVIDMIRKVLFDYEMFGIEKTHNMIEEYDEHLYRGISYNIEKNLKINKSIKKLRLPFDDIYNDMFKRYIIMIADEVLYTVNEKNKMILQYTIDNN